MSAYSDAIIADGPQSYWRLGEPSGITVVDAMGLQNGTLTNGPVLAQAGAIAGDADTSLSFDGADDFIDLGSTNYKFLGRTPFSCECWVKPTTAFNGAKQSFVYRGFAAVTWHFAMEFSLLKMERFDVSTAKDVVFSNTPLVDGKWQYVVGTYDGRYMRLYVNGVFNGMLASTRAVSDPGETTKAGNSGTAARPYGGLMDELAIYNYPLSLDQIQSHYSIGIGNTTNLVPSELRKHLDRRHNGAWSTSGSNNIVLAGSAGIQELEELVRAARANQYYVSIVGGALTLIPT